jgi:hypothetical protein
MREDIHLIEDSPINDAETKELIKRLSDPSFFKPTGQSTVRDLAETLEMNPSQVIAGLERIRAEKVVQPVQVFESGPGVFFATNSNKRYHKLASVMIFTALAVTAVMFLFLLRSSNSQNTLMPAPVVREEPIKVQQSDQPVPIDKTRP